MKHISICALQIVLIQKQRAVLKKKKDIFLISNLDNVHLNMHNCMVVEKLGSGKVIGHDIMHMLREKRIQIIEPKQFKMIFMLTKQSTKMQTTEKKNQKLKKCMCTKSPLKRCSIPGKIQVILMWLSEQDTMN